MKRVIALVLAMIMLLCSCGGDGTAEVGKEPAIGEKKEYKIGEKIVTDNWEFTVTDIYIGKKPKLYDSKGANLDSDFLVSEDEDGYQAVDDADKTFVGIAYTMKYLGKESIDSYMWIPHPVLVYGDGYTFEDEFPHDYTYVWVSKALVSDYDDIGFVKVKNTSKSEFKPLDPEKEFRKGFLVPVEIETNSSEPLKIGVMLEEGTFNWSFKSEDAYYVRIR